MIGNAVLFDNVRLEMFHFSLIDTYKLGETTHKEILNLLGYKKELHRRR